VRHFWCSQELCSELYGLVGAGLLRADDRLRELEQRLVPVVEEFVVVWLVVVVGHL
jgi:hypothetical protein